MSTKHRTDILLKLISDGGPYPGHFRVQLNRTGFPYIILPHTQKPMVIATTSFPCPADIWEVEEVDIIQGLDELKVLLSNPELTMDKIPASYLVLTGNK